MKAGEKGYASDSFAVERRYNALVHASLYKLKEDQTPVELWPCSRIMHQADQSSLDKRHVSADSTDGDKASSKHRLPVQHLNHDEHAHLAFQT